MQHAIVSATVSAAASVSPVESAVSLALSAIESRDCGALHSAICDLSDAVGAKPKSADFLTREDYKTAMNRWDADRKQVARIFRAAESAGLTVTERFSANATKSGAVTLAQRRAVSIKPAFRSARV